MDTKLLRHNRVGAQSTVLAFVALALSFAAAVGCRGPSAIVDEQRVGDSGQEPLPQEPRPTDVLASYSVKQLQILDANQDVAISIRGTAKGHALLKMFDRGDAGSRVALSMAREEDSTSLVLYSDKGVAASLSAADNGGSGLQVVGPRGRAVASLAKSGAGHPLLSFSAEDGLMRQALILTESVVGAATLGSKGAQQIVSYLHPSNAARLEVRDPDAKLVRLWEAPAE